MSDQLKETIKDISIKDFELKEDTQSLYKAVKDNPKDKIEIELGDSKDSKELYPQAKIQRWDNEVNFSIRYKEDSSKEKKEVNVVDNKLVWSKGQKEVHIYEKPEIGEDGGLELEVLLKEKPVSNVIEFSIETKGLDFFYQPELTQEEKEKGATRPENVIGSYAVYHSTKRDNFPNKEYKTGKAFHIYRPKVIDSNGSEIWGKLNVDVEGKLLTVTIDEKWLDKAIYPVLIDPTFGYDSGGSSWQQLSSPFGTRFVSPSDITEADSLSSYIKFISGGPPNEVFRQAIFIESNGNIVSNSACGDSSESNTSAHWNTHSYITKPSITASTEYILMCGSGDGYGYIVVAYDSGTSGQGISQWFPSLSYANMDLAYTTDDNSKYSIYVTYTASGGGGTEANAERNIYLSGKDTSSATRNLYLQGKSTSNATRNIWLSGLSIANAERNIYLSGVNTANAERNLYLMGCENGFADFNIYLEGSVASAYTRENASDLETDDANLSTTYTEQDYEDVATDDDTFLDLSGTAVYFKYLFKEYNSNGNNTDPFIVTWKGKSTKAPSSATVYLQIYNRTTEGWENLDTDSSSNANTEFTLAGNISTSLSDYYDGYDVISCRVYQEVL